jgi:hypothetical protein
MENIIYADSPLAELLEGAERPGFNMPAEDV